jgi:hypothetical protein
VLTVAVADGISGHAAGRGDNADRDAVLQRPRRAGPASAEPARQVCAACPVRQPCLDYAITNRITHGIWGGLTERERRALRSGWVRASWRERDQAILAAEYTAVAIGRSFSLSRTSVTRIVRTGDDAGRPG